MPKHWTHVAKSGVSFLVSRRSAACTTTVWPSTVLGIDLTFPLAGGSSAKSMYFPANIFSTYFLGSEGSPSPVATRDDEDGF